MWDAIGKIVDWLKSPRQCAAVFLVSLTLFLFPSRVFLNNGLELIVRYRGGILLLAILSGAILITESSIYVWQHVTTRTKARQFQRYVAALIPSMTEEEKGIIGYLLAKDQRVFTNSPDGGHATTLISKRIVVPAVVPGQTFSYYEMPFKIPDDVWEVLIAHKAEFPYMPPDDGESERHPWRRHWAAY